MSNNKSRDKKNRPIMNNELLKFPEVRCIGEDGNQYGIISGAEALDLAQEEDLDIVVIAENAKPPVAKIMDYGKFKYQEEKRRKEAKKNQKNIVVKEIKLSVKIADNDINFKVKHARDFISKGYHVKFRVFLKGREMSNPEAGKDVLLKVWDMVKDIATMEKQPFFEGRYFNMTIVPQKK